MTRYEEIWAPRPFLSVQRSGSGDHLAWAYLCTPEVAIITAHDWKCLDGDQLARGHRIVGALSDASGETLFVAPITGVRPPDDMAPFARLELDPDGYDLTDLDDPVAGPSPYRVAAEKTPEDSSEDWVETINRVLAEEPPEDWLAKVNEAAALPSAGRKRFPFVQAPPEDRTNWTVCHRAPKLCGRHTG